MIDIEKMSQVELADMARILHAQVQARDEDRLSLYKPHKFQSLFHQSNKKIRLMICGNRAGKSECSIMELLWMCLGIHPHHQRPVPIKAKIYFESFALVSEVFEPKLQRWLPQKYLSAKRPFIRNQHGDLTGINFLNGSMIRVGTYDQQEGKSEGSDWSVVVFDEPPPRSLYIANMRGLMDSRGIMWFAMTPLKEAWIFDELYQPGLAGKLPHVEVFRWTSYDNPHVPRDEIDIYAASLKPHEYETRILGKFKKLQGLVVDTYEPEISNVDPFDLDEDYAIYEGIDPHPNKPNTVLWKAIDRGGFRFVVRELSHDEGISKLGEKIVEVRNDLRKNGARIVKCIADTSLNVKDIAFKMNQKDELTKVLLKLGETVIPENALKKDWVNPGIQKLRELYRPSIMIEGKLMPMQYVFKSCPMYIYQLLHYQWAEGLGEARPKKENDDLIDPDRYIEAVAPKFIVPGQSQFTRTYNGAYQRKMGMERYVGYWSAPR